MLAARVLSDHFDDVTLLEAATAFPRRRPPARGCPRAGTCTFYWDAAAEFWKNSSRA